MEIGGTPALAAAVPRLRSVGGPTAERTLGAPRAEGASPAEVT